MDELTSYLYSADPEHIVIGKKDCNLLILGDKSRTPTAIRLLLLTIGIAEPVTDKTIELLRVQYRQDKIFRRLFRCAKDMAAASGIPALLTCYQTFPLCQAENNDSFLDDMLFMVREIYPTSGQEQAVVYKSDAFVSYLYRTMGVQYTDSGTDKEKNKRLADVFHVWSRAKLSAHIVKQDFDAIYHNQDRFKMIEVKRSPKRSLSVWAPYSNDKRNYDIQSQISKMLHAPFYTLHYNGGPCDGSTPIGRYLISNVDLQNTDSWIQYDKSIVTAGEMVQTLNQEQTAGGKSTKYVECKTNG